MLGIFLYTLIAALSAFGMIYLSLLIREKDQTWMGSPLTGLNVRLCIIIAVFWPFTILISMAVIAAKMLFGKES